MAIMNLARSLQYFFWILYQQNSYLKHYYSNK